MTLLTLIIASFYYFLPVYFANGAPVILKKINLIKTPVDFNKTLKNPRFFVSQKSSISKKIKGLPVFGTHKTWGGLILASLTGILIFYLQKLLYIYPFFQKYSLIDYTQYSILLGFLLGFGAIFGDLIKSFFKRRFQIKPGKSWIPFDQLDFVLGAFIFSFIIYIPPAFAILAVIIISPFLHIIANHLGYYLKIKKSKW